MYRIHCKECDEETILDTIPERCTNPNCGCPREECLEIEMISSQQSESTLKGKQQLSQGITLIYQKTGEEIHIPKIDRIVLGRESYGHEVLGKVKYISGVHCAIEYADNQYMVTDLDSRNGTFLGISRIDCKANPKQVLNDGDLLFLGREAFLVRFSFKSEETEAEIKGEIREDGSIAGSVVETKEIKVQKYRCKDCGAEFDKTEFDKMKIGNDEDTCPECNAYGTLEVFEV